MGDSLTCNQLSICKQLDMLDLCYPWVSSFIMQNLCA